MTGTLTSGPFRPLRRALLVASLAVLAATSMATSRPALAQSAVAAPAQLERPLWKELTRQQQQALEPLAGLWDAMDAERKQKWLEIGNRFASMKREEQQRMHERMRDWVHLTPEERRIARENYTLAKQLGKNARTAQWEQYQQLPEEEKRKLAAEAAAKKQVTNLPPKTQPKAVAPINPAPPVPHANK